MGGLRVAHSLGEIRMKWTKPSGLEIETNDMEATIEYCKSLGWVPENGKRMRRTKIEMEAARKKEASELEARELEATQ